MSRSRDLFERFKKRGKKAIQECIDNETSEWLFLDYKQTESCNKAGVFTGRDQDNLSKAISGFGNSSGGVVVWGVKCRKEHGKDVPTEMIPIKEVNQFRSNLEGWISGLTLPAHNGVENHTIKDGRTKNGYVITHIPRSDYAPLRSLRKNNYYLRAGSNFGIVTHDVLAGMFGKRPQPKLNTEFRPVMSYVSAGPNVAFGCDVIFRNVGATIIRDLYVTSKTVSLPGDKDNFYLAVGTGEGWKLIGNMTKHSTVVSRADFSLVPGDSVVGATMNLRAELPSTEAFEIEVNYGCEGGEVHTLRVNVGAELFRRVYEELAAMGDFEILKFRLGGEVNAWKAIGEHIHRYSPTLWIPGTPYPETG